MLEVIGVQDANDLYQSLPDSLRLDALDLPLGLSELEVKEFLKKIANKNTSYDYIWRGAGAYHHDIPAIVTQVLSKERFITAYTPYQAELSQGILQGIFEFQTLMSELTGLPVSNASMYDGASAAAEACRVTLRRKRDRIILAGALDPKIVDVIRSYFSSGDARFDVCPAGDDGLIDMEALEELAGDDLAGVFVMQLNARGLIEDVKAVSDFAHKNKALSVVYSNPMSLAILETPGALGADLCVGDAQPLGIPLSYGGPYVGFLCSTDKLKRKLPGRIIGETVDRNGTRSFVLTLQTREQHIRREKATSNICTNQALCALQASVYLTAVGPNGLRRQAENSYANAHLLAKDLAELGFKRIDEQEFFHEFITSVPEGVELKALEEYLSEQGHLMGLPVGDEQILWCATELNHEEARNELVASIKAFLEGGQA